MVSGREGDPTTDGEKDWLQARAAEIVRRNPGGVFPQDDREFVERTMKLILVIARAQVRGRSYALFDGEDLAQEANLRVTQAFPSFRGENYPGWLYMIVRHVFFDMVKVDRQTTSVEGILSPDSTSGRSPEYVFADQVDVAQEVDATTLINDFKAWLYKRNAKHARIIELDLEGLPDREIAERVGVAYRTVCSVLRRAPNDYRRFLGRMQGEKLKQARYTGRR